MRVAIEGTCICGAVTLAAARMPRKVTQCNCSVCRRYGTLWAYYRRKDARITGKREPYVVRRGGLRFMRCAACGCVTSWEHKRGAGDWIALNARLFDHEKLAAIEISVLDGDQTWRVIDRYRKPAMWISPTR